MVIQKVTLLPWSLPSLICAVPPGSPSTVPVISESPFSATLIGTSCSLNLNDPAHVPVISAAGAIAAIKRSSPVNVRWRFIRTHSIKGHPTRHHALDDRGDADARAERFQPGRHRTNALSLKRIKYVAGRRFAADAGLYICSS